MSTSTAQTLLAQTIVAANQAAAAALEAQTYAQQVANKAPIDSPAFTGTPTAPTPPANDNSSKLATTAYLDRLIGVANGIPPLDNTGKIPASFIPPMSITAVIVVASQAAMLASGAAAGTIAIRTDQSNAEYILSATPASTLGNWYAIGTSPVLSVAGLTGAITAHDLTLQLLAFTGDSGSGGAIGLVPAPSAGDAAAHKVLTAGGAWGQIAASWLSDGTSGTGAMARVSSPTFLGVPLAPTAAVDTNTGQLATLAWVLNQGATGAGDLPVIDGTAAVGVSTHWARADHVHPTDTSRAPLVSPAFSGNPTAPTQSANNNSTRLATTEYVDR